MIMANQQQIARYLEQEREHLVPALLSKVDLPQRDGEPALVKAWLENHIALLRGQPCPLAEWAARFTIHNHMLGKPAGEAFACIEGLRKALIECCQGKIARISDIDLSSALTDTASLIAQAVFAYVTECTSCQPDISKQRNQAILDAVTIPMALITPDGTIETVNAPFCRTFKTDKAALEGTALAALCNEATAASASAFLSGKQAKTGSLSFDGEFHSGRITVQAKTTFHPLIGPDGSCAGAVVALEDNPKGIAAPDTGLRYIEERLLPLIPLASQMVDGEGNITFSSEQIAHLPVNGYEGGEPICCFLYRHRHGENSECPCKSVLNTGQFYLGEISYDSRMEIKWFRLVIAPVPDDDGRVARVFCCVYDMTRRKQVQKQLESQIIEQQRSSLVAQQLRNPLSVVLGFAEMMAKGLAPEQYAEAVSRILRNSIRCKDIVESLLDFGRGMPLQQRVVDLEVLIRESVCTMLTPAQNRLVTWIFSGKSTPIECVPEQMTQVVLSLLHNAVHAAQSQVVCTLENKGDLVRLRVVDDGPGIPLDLRERVFEPFYTTRRNEGATGLGLSLARAVITDFGGSLTVCAPVAGEPRGACLVLQLPLVKQKAPGPETALIPETLVPERRVLIVDDEADMQDLLKTSLYLHGFLADTVATGMEALEKLKQAKYDVVVLDYKIVGALSCAQLYNEILEQHAHLVPHILFLTGDMLNHQTRLFIQNTGRPVLEKPFHMKDFLGSLTRLVH